MEASEQVSEPLLHNNVTTNATPDRRPHAIESNWLFRCARDFGSVGGVAAMLLYCFPLCLSALSLSVALRSGRQFLAEPIS
eukprot:scaffold16721_cov36-Attheya_sp.AAC.3